jgi:predicted phosphodiesterase
MKFRLFADTHLNSPIEILRHEVLTEPPHENTLFLGDILDFANSKKDDLETLETFYQMLKSKHGENYIVGNHCRKTIINETVIKTTEYGTRICFVHGDIEANPERWIEYRQKPHGAGWFKRKFIIPFIREAEEIIERKPKKENIERLCAKANSHNCSVIILGHHHPKEMIDFVHTYLGRAIRIIILPRGLTELEIE